MERLFSLLGIYDLLGFILPGGLFASGIYWAYAGLPHEPGGATAIGLVGLFFIAGELVQGISVLWERWAWSKMGGWPSERLMHPEDARAFDARTRALIEEHLARRHGVDVSELPTSRKLALARADLRAANSDGRSELLNARYSLDRALVTTTLALAVAFGIAALTTDDHRRNTVAFLVAIAALPVFFNRFRRFGMWFALQVWQDFAALDVGPR